MSTLPPLPDLNDAHAVARWARTTGAWTDPITADKMAVILRAYGEACAAVEREACISIIEHYKVSVGNSRSGELAAEWTMENLKEVRDAIRARGKT